MSPVLRALKEINVLIVQGGRIESGELKARITLAIHGLEWKPIAHFQHGAPEDGTWVELRGENKTPECPAPYRIMLARFERQYEDEVDEKVSFLSSGLLSEIAKRCWRLPNGRRCDEDGPMPTHWRPAS